jgi:hypothetical protein
MKYIKSHIPKPKQAIQLSIKVIEQADQEAQQLRTSKYVRRIVEYFDKSINKNK